MTKAKAKPKTKAKPKKKTTAKPKAAKKKTVKLTPNELYESFMKCVQKAEDAKTATTRKKWIKTAKSDHKKLLKVEEDLSSAKLKRMKRTFSFLEELEAEK